jgi:hypothetical protein
MLAPGRKNAWSKWFCSLLNCSNRSAEGLNNPFMSVSFAVVDENWRL